MNSTMLIAPWVENAGWALLHSLWQCTLTAIAAATLLGWLRGRLTISQKYWVLCASLVAMVLLPFCTYGLLLLTTSGSTPMTLPTLATSGTSTDPGGTVANWEAPYGVLAVLSQVAPWIFWSWALGVSVSFFKLLRGWRLAQKLTTWQTTAAPEQWRVRFERLSSALGVSTRAELRSSVATSVPCLIGWLKPIVLVPASAFTGMDPDRLESVLAHELAHVKRNDYPISVLQGVAEALFFYHPAIWWASEQVSATREQCCDDIAVQACGDVTTYVRALADLEAGRQSAMAALAATDGSLTGRVRRLLGAPELPQRASAPFAGLVSAAFALALAASLTLAQTPAKTAGEARAQGRETKPSRDEVLFQFFDESRSAKEKRDAISRISGSNSAAAWKKLSTIAESDPEQSVREEAVSYIAGRANEAAARELIRLYDVTDNSAMRMHVLSYLSGLTSSPLAKSKVLDISRDESDPQIRAKAIDYVLGR